MKAIVMVPRARTVDFEMVDIDAPTGDPAPGQVRVRVVAASINRSDLLIREGLHPVSWSAGPVVGGLDLAGEVVAIGAGVRTLQSGDRVMAMASGGYAELVDLVARI